MDMLLPFALILVAFYLLILRPQRTRARLANQLQARLAPGVEVMTTAGLFGTVTEVRDDSVLLEVSPGVTVRFTKAAVGRIVTEDTSAVAEDDGPEDADGDPHGHPDDDADTRRGRNNAGE